MNFIIYPLKSSIAFYIFNYPIHWYGIIISFAILVGIVSAYFTVKNKYSYEHALKFLDFSPMIILYSILGARIFYVLGDFGFYLKNPAEIIMLNHGGLSLWGAILFGIISLFLYSKHLKIDFLKNLDMFALFMPLCQAIGRWGNYFNQEAYGYPSNSFAKLFVDSSHRFDNYLNVEFYHPAFLYEMALDFILFLMLFFLFKNKTLKDGTITCLYLIFYGLIRIFMEQIRIDSVCYVFNLPIASLISFFAIIIALISLIVINLKK